jgi:O-antigen ligase
MVALLLVVMIGSRTARHALLTFGFGAMLVTAALWPLLPPEFSQRLSSVVTSAVDIGSLPSETVTPDNWAVLERLSQWYAGWQMFANNPVLGVGIGNYNAAYETYGLDEWPVALGHAHNHYLTIAAEAGLVGLGAYLLWLGAAFRSGARAFFLAQDRLGRAAAVGILGSLASFATHNLFDVLFVHGMGVTVGLLLALLEGIPRGMEDPPPSVAAAVEPSVPPAKLTA